MLYLSQDSHQELYTFMQTKWQRFKCFIVYLQNFRQFFPSLTNIMDLVYRGWEGGDGGRWGVEGGLFHTSEQKTAAFSSLVSLIRSLTAV